MIDELIFLSSAGPAGLQAAIDYRMMGANVVVLEKRLDFGRHNVMKLWPSSVAHLKSIGLKYFFPKFCCGGLEHISIRKLQLCMTKIALLLGIDIWFGTSFEGVESPKFSGAGWDVRTITQSMGDLRFCEKRESVIVTDILIGADGVRSKVGESCNFSRRKEGGRTRLLGITCNFEKYGTIVERNLKEFSLISYLNQNRFRKLETEYGIQLENLVFFRDETFYFVMTPKIRCLVKKGVLRSGEGSPQQLLESSNVNVEKLEDFAREIGEFCGLPQSSKMILVRGKPDVQIFDFSTKMSCTQQIRFLDAPSHLDDVNPLMVGVVGDALIEPFWPLGTGANRALQSGMDIAWLGQRFCSNVTTEEIKREGRQILQALINSDENLLKKPSSFTIDPASRYVKFLVDEIIF